MASGAAAHQEVVRLDVAVNVALGVDDLQAAEQLICEHQDSLEVKTPSTVVEQVFQALAEQVDDHDVVVAFNSVPSHDRNTNCAHTTTTKTTKHTYVSDQARSEEHTS